MSLKLTPSGADLLLRALAGTAEVHFTHVKLGSGTDAGSSAADLTTPKMSFPIHSITIAEDFALLTIAYNNNDVPVGFRCTEFGVFAIDPDDSSASILYAYEYTDPATADYVPSNTDRTLETEIRALVYVGDAATVTAEIPSGIYALIDHSHNASDIKFGILSAARGGTGGSTGRIVLGQSTRNGSLGSNATAEGTDNNSEGWSSHTNGTRNAAIGDQSTAIGFKATAVGDAALASGYQSFALGQCSFAGGGEIGSVIENYAIGHSSFAYGRSVRTYGSCSVALGLGAQSLKGYSQAMGYSTRAYNPYMAVFGAYNRIVYDSSGGGGGFIDDYPLTSQNYPHMTAPTVTVDEGYEDDLLVVGSGSASARSNAFRVTRTATFGLTYNASGADYAEMFEWADGNPGGEDRVGHFVTLDGAKIRLATPEDDYILGVVSGNPSVCADASDDQWHEMYLRDIYGRPVIENVCIPEELNAEGEIIQPAYVERRWKLNPDYDDSQTYVPRSLRKEWDAVGMVGKLVVVDDGTCDPNGWASVGVGGIATATNSRTSCRVMERLDASHIRVLIL